MSFDSPITASNLWLGHAAAVAGASLVVLALVGTGSLLGRWLPLGRTAVNRMLTSSALGLAVLGPAIYWAGHLAWSRGILALGLGALAWTGICQIGRERTGLFTSLRTARRSPWAWLAAAGIGLVALSGLAEPLGGIENEAVASTLLAGRQWLERGSAGFVPDHPYTSLPWNVETLYAAALALGGVSSPGVLAAWWLTLLAALAWRLARDLGVAARWAPVAAALVATMPMLQDPVDRVGVDVAFAALALAAVRAAIAAREPSVARVAAVLAGGATSTAVFGWWIAAATLVIAGGVLGWRRGRVAVLGVAPSVVLIIAALGLPWFARNLVILGAPAVPPLPWFWPVFSPTGWTQQLAIDVLAWHRHVWLGPAAQPWGLWDFLRLPWNLQRHAADFLIAPPGLLVFVALWPGIWALRRKPVAWWVFGWAFATVLVWFFSWHNGRLLTPVAALACVASAAAFAAFDRARWGRYTLGLLLVLLVWGTARDEVTFLQSRQERIKAVFSTQVAEARREREIPYRPALAWLNRDPAVTRVLLITKWVPGYYLDKPYVKVAGHFGESPLKAAPYYDFAVARAAELGCSHVLDIHDAREGWHVGRPDQPVELYREWPEARLFVVKQAQ